jgi:hypothetical protein
VFICLIGVVLIFISIYKCYKIVFVCLTIYVYRVVYLYTDPVAILAQDEAKHMADSLGIHMNP